MGALENYQRRVSGTIGSSVKEYVKGQVRTNLDKFLENSQYGMDVIINGKEERIGIMTGAMSDTRDEVLVLSKLDTLKMGTLFEWENEFWVVVKREARVIKESFYGTAYRCNVDLKWVNKDGILVSQKAYAKGRGLSSILVENKYTDPPVISREVDTPITVITQRNPELEQDMRFLFDKQPYRVTFVDNLSIDGTTILGMYDDIIHDGDDLENNIADYNNHYTIELDFDTPIIGKVGEPFEVTYTLLNDGVEDDTKEIIISAPEGKADIEGNKITPLVEESIPVVVSLAQNELIYAGFTIEAGKEWTSEENLFVVGPDKIAWNKSAKYYLNTHADVQFVIDDEAAPKVKYKITETANEITISVGEKYSGKLVLLAINDMDIITKDIEIVSVEG